MKNSFKKAVCLAGTAVLSASMLATGMSASAAGGGGVWVTGDPNTRTYLSDGGKTAEQVAALAKANGLDWIGIADAGGGTAGTRDQNGTAWEGGAVPRWRTISGGGEDEIGKARPHSPRYRASAGMCPRTAAPRSDSRGPART